MGFVHVQVGISNAESPGREERIELLVDTGATLSVIPRSVLVNLGVRQIGRRRFKGFGGVIERDTANVLMRDDDAVAGVTAIFGEDGDTLVMGVTALETLGYQVDPVAGELRQTEMLQL